MINHAGQMRQNFDPTFIQYYDEDVLNICHLHRYNMIILYIYIHAPMFITYNILHFWAVHIYEGFITACICPFLLTAMWTKASQSLTSCVICTVASFAARSAKVAMWAICNGGKINIYSFCIASIG